MTEKLTKAEIYDRLEVLHDVASNYGLMKAEQGSSYVHGGGLAEDAGAAVAQFFPELDEGLAEVEAEIKALTALLPKEPERPRPDIDPGELLPF